jgi:hypothetical protein
MEPLALAVIAIACFWVGLIVGVHLDDWYRDQSGGDQNEDQD